MRLVTEMLTQGQEAVSGLVAEAEGALELLVEALAPYRASLPDGEALT